MLAIIFSVFLVTLFLGFPVAVCLALTACAGLLFHDVSMLVVVQRMFKGFDSFSLLAVPFFVLAGDLMNNLGVLRLHSGTVAGCHYYSAYIHIPFTFRSILLEPRLTACLRGVNALTGDRSSDLPSVHLYVTYYIIAKSNPYGV